MTEKHFYYHSYYAPITTATSYAAYDCKGCEERRYPQGTIIMTCTVNGKTASANTCANAKQILASKAGMPTTTVVRSNNSPPQTSGSVKDYYIAPLSNKDKPQSSVPTNDYNKLREKWFSTAGNGKLNTTSPSSSNNKDDDNNKGGGGGLPKFDFRTSGGSSSGGGFGDFMGGNGKYILIGGGVLLAFMIMFMFMR